MENFIKGNADKLSAQEMIRANTAAEAAHREQIETQNRHYEEEIKVLKDNATKLEARLSEIESNLLDVKEIEKRIDKSDEATHDVGVRIYRNVQASVIDEQKKQLDEIKEDFKKQLDSIRGEFSVLTRRLDTTRNQLEEEYRNNNKPVGKGLMPVSIIIMLVVIADLVLNILRILGMV